MSDLLRDRLIAAVGDHYLVEAELGRGGMAAVFRALDLRLNRPVAIKVLPPEFAFNAGVRSRFMREAQMAAQLSHPHVVPIYSVDERDGLVYYVMALVDGVSVARLLAERGSLPVDQVRAIVAEVADALDYAHRQGVVHRDIKPDNILIDARGRAAVTDFGIARAAAEESRLTVTGMAVGTPAYMSPEQAMGEREVDGRSDIYSLGIVAYQMLAGAPPFQAANTPAMLMKHVSEPPTPIIERRRDTPASLARAIDRSLAKRPEDRWHSAADFRAAVLSLEVPPEFASRSLRHPPADHGRLDPAPNFDRGSHRNDRLHHAMHQAREALPGYPAQGAPLGEAPPRPQMPIIQPPPAGLTRRERKEWYREQRRALREAFDAGAVLDEKGRDRIGSRIARFRRRVVQYIAISFFLGVINAGTGGEPWFLFPMFSLMLAGFIQLMALWWGNDVPLRKIFFGSTRPPDDPVAMRWSGASHHQVQRLGNGTSRPSAPAPLSRQPMLGAPAHAPPHAPQRQAPDPAAGLAPPDVLAGPHGQVIRRGAASRQVIGDVLGRMQKQERTMLPRDLEETVNALVERVVSVGITLHRLDTDANGATLGSLDQRIDALKAESQTPESERRLALLERQRATLRDLLDRRAALLAQMESAALALENLKLDLVRFRSAGVGSALEDVTSATREARAVSRDIGNLLDAQDEVRKL